jgi:hypothetical protein
LQGYSSSSGDAAAAAVVACTDNEVHVRVDPAMRCRKLALAVMHLVGKRYGVQALYCQQILLYNLIAQQSVWHAVYIQSSRCLL